MIHVANQQVRTVAGQHLSYRCVDILIGTDSAMGDTVGIGQHLKIRLTGQFHTKGTAVGALLDLVDQTLYMVLQHYDLYIAALAL